MASADNIKKLVLESCECEEKISVGNVCFLICMILESMMEENDGVFGYIREELGNQTIKALCMSLTGSIIGSLYGSATLKNKEEAIEFARKHGIDEVKAKKEIEKMLKNEA